MSVFATAPTKARLIRRVTVVCALLCGAMMPAPSGVGAAPDIEGGEDAVLLRESLDIDILSRTDARVRVARTMRVLTSLGAQEQSETSIPFNPWVQIRDVRAFVTASGGKRLAVKKQHMWNGSYFASFELYAESKHRTVNFPGSVPGATLELEYETAVRNLFFLPTFFPLQGDLPARERALTVRLPAGMRLRHAVRGAAPEYAREEKDGFVIHRWRVRDVPALKPERWMPPWDDLTPRVSLYLDDIQWDEHRMDASSWDGVARWYWELARDRMVPDETVAAAAREITADAADPREKMRRVYDFARGKVQYVAIQLGIGGWQPHASRDVLRHRYGDCKDKATLMISMLRVLGIEAYPVLILTRDEGVIDRAHPSGGFNHAIVALPQPDGWLFADPTAEKVPFGELPWTDQGVPVLIVKGDGTGEIAETPLLSPERNRRRHLVSAAVDDAGTLTGTYVMESWGSSATEMAHFLESKPDERQDDVAALTSWFCPGAVLLGHEVTPPATRDDPLRITVRFEIPRYVTKAAGREIVTPYLMRFPAARHISAYAGRRFPVFFDFLYTDVVEMRLRLPAGRALRKLPPDRDASLAGLTSSTRHEMAREGGRHVLVIRRTLSIARREFPVADYAALRDLFAALVQEEGKAVALVPEG